MSKVLLDKNYPEREALMEAVAIMATARYEIGDWFSEESLKVQRIMKYLRAQRNQLHEEGCDCAICKRGTALICPRSVPAGDAYHQALDEYMTSETSADDIPFA